MNGTPVAAALPNGDAALALNGTSQYVEIADANVFSVPTNGLTIEAWIRPDVLTFTNHINGYVNFLGKGASGQRTNGWPACTTSTREPPTASLGYAFNSTGGSQVSSYFQDTLTAGQWIHVAIVITSTGSTKIYKNGVLRDQDTGSITLSNGTAPVRIGTRDLAEFFKGDREGGVLLVPGVPDSAGEHYNTMVSTQLGYDTLVLQADPLRLLRARWRRDR